MTTVRSAPPPSAPLVYTILVVLGMLAAIGSSVLLGVITYNYVTREELRNPTPHEEGLPGGEVDQSGLPAWIIPV